MIGIGIGSIILVFILLVVSVTGYNNAYKGSETKVVKSKSAEIGKALLVYQPSKSGASTTIAEQISEGLSESGYEVTITYPGKHMDFDGNKYDIVGFGTPVFFGKPSSILANALHEMQALENKTVFIYSVGGTPEKPELEELKKQITSGTIKYEEKFMAKDSQQSKAAYEYGKKIGSENQK